MSPQLICSKLNAESRSEIENLWNQKKTLFKSPLDEDYRKKLQNRLDHILDPKEERLSLFGVFNEGKLIATWVVFRWLNLPSYSLNELVIDNPQKSSQLYIACVNSLLNKIFPLMESEGYYSFYILALLRSYQLRALKKGKMWEVPPELTPYQRYDLSIECLIPPMTKPNFTYWDLMGQRYWPQTLWVRRGRLKDEFLIPQLLKSSNREHTSEE